MHPELEQLCHATEQHTRWLCCPRLPYHTTWQPRHAGTAAKRILLGLAAPLPLGRLVGRDCCGQLAPRGDITSTDGSTIEPRGTHLACVRSMWKSPGPLRRDDLVAKPAAGFIGGNQACLLRCATTAGYQGWARTCGTPRGTAHGEAIVVAGGRSHLRTARQRGRRLVAVRGYPTVPAT